MGEHTPTPWQWHDVAGAGIEICAPIGGQIKGFMQPGYEKHPIKIYQLCGPANVQIACERWVQFEPEGWSTMQKANAHFIVTACNSHAGLLELAAEAMWRRDYPNGGSMHKTYDSLGHRDKEIHRKEALDAALSPTGEEGL